MGTCFRWAWIRCVCVWLRWAWFKGVFVFCGVVERVGERQINYISVELHLLH